MEHCLNCSSQLTGRFCTNCGQRSGARRLDWPWLWHEAQHGVLHVDKGLFYTLKALFVRPGIAIREFLEGKRVRHFKPLALVSLLAAIYSFGFFLCTPPAGESFLTPSTKASFDHMVSVVMGYYALFELGSIPVFAFWSWSLMRRYGHNYVEHLVINTFLAGQRIAVNILGLPFNMLGLEASLLYSTFAWLLYLGYYLFGFGQLYAEGQGAGPIVRALAAFMLFWLVVGLVTIAISIKILIDQAAASAPVH